MNWQAMMQEFENGSSNAQLIAEHKGEFLRALQLGACDGCREMATALMNVLDGIFMLDDDGHITDCYLTKVIHCNPHNLIGSHVSEIVSRSQYNTIVDAVDHCRTHDTTSEFNITVSCEKQDQADQTFCVLMACHNDGYIALVRDVSRLQNLNAQLEEAERRFQTIANSVGDSVVITDTEGCFTYVSKSIQSTVGWLPEQMLGRSAFEFIHPQDAPVVRKIVRNSMDDKQSISFEHRFLTASGVYVWLDTVFQAIRGTDGKHVAYQAVSRDVTEHRANERRLKQLWHLFEQSSGMFAVITAEGKIDYINPSLLRHLHIDEQDVRLMNFEALIPAGADPKILYQIHQSIYNGKPWDGELSGKSPNGAAFTCLARFSPVIDNLGEMTHNVVELIDITDRKRSETLIEQKSEQLSVVNRELQEFAYVVSHDLKAPLRSISTLADWLVADYTEILPEDGKENLRILKERAVRMQQLIDGILEYSRVGRISEQVSHIDMDQLLNDVVGLVNPPANCELVIQPNLPHIDADPVRMIQLFQNLICNAIKHNDKEKCAVEVCCLDDGDMWRFGVRDNGPGIDPKYHEMIFGIFQTLSNKDDNPDSTGIGLSLVRKIVELHKGKIWVDSAVNQGCTFWFTLPKSADTPSSLVPQE